MEEKRNNSSKLLIVAICAVIVSISAFFLSLNFTGKVIQSQEIPIMVKIDNYTALNITKNQQELHLGIVSKGNSGERNLSISNNYPFKTSFEFEIRGDIAPLVIYPKLVVFEANESKGILFRTKFIENESFGVYSGIIGVNIRRIYN